MLAELLSKNDLTLRGKIKADLADCQHEQIIESSAHALSFDVDTLRKKILPVSSCATAINIDSPPAADFTFVITPDTKISTGI